MGYKWLMPSMSDTLSRFKPRRHAIKNIAKRLIQGKFAAMHETRPKSHFMPDLLTRLEDSFENVDRQLAGP